MSGSTLRFEFRGKSGIKHVIDLNDRRLARIVKRCQDLPGQELFQYIDADEQRYPIDSADVNDYLRAVSGADFTAKDFRTWAGTVLAACALMECPDYESRAQAKREVVQAIESVAKRLGNTKAVCRKCYIHPAVIDAFLDGSLRHSLQIQTGRGNAEPVAELRPEEVAILAFLQSQGR